MDRLTPEREAELRGLWDEATPGPWKPEIGRIQNPDPFDERGDAWFPRMPFSIPTNDAESKKQKEQAQRDAALIAASRSAVPELLAEIAALRTDLAKAEHLTRTTDASDGSSVFDGSPEIQPPELYLPLSRASLLLMLNDERLGYKQEIDALRAELATAKALRVPAPTERVITDMAGTANPVDTPQRWVPDLSTLVASVSCPKCGGRVTFRTETKPLVECECVGTTNSDGMSEWWELTFDDQQKGIVGSLVVHCDTLIPDSDRRFVVSIRAAEGAE
jgi:hypothetical protein